MGFLVNIDNGGTFTDVCISNGGKIVHAKAITTPHDLTQCFMEAMKRGSRELYGDEDLARLIRETDCLRYSTTSGTNAVVEHKGTQVALLVEAGEEEAVYGAIARFGSSALWKAMVPERPCGIRVATDGTIDGHELTRIVNHLLAAGAQRLVVTLKSSVAEQNVKEALLDRYPRHLLGAIPFLISTELVQDPDHARRTSTAVINSYLHPGMEHFLYSAENICKQHHLKRPLLIFRNDGDSARVAKTTAIKTWGSGPRGGLEGTIAYSKLYGADTLVAMDIGGTTTDVSVVMDGKVPQNAYGEVEDMQTSFPLPELQSFGLGGSSIVKVVDGRIVIGPESVGAAPGPACFARGGTNATLTDALLIAGVLDPEQYLGGELKLDIERALLAVKTQVGESIGKNAQEAASAIIAAFQEQVGAHLAAIIAHAGRDPKQATLVAFGGGGPMIATGIAGAVGISRVIVPRFAAVFSAFGIGFSHLAHEYQVPVAGLDEGSLPAVKADMALRARRDMSGEGVDPESCRFVYSLWRAVDGKVEETPLADGTPPANLAGDARLTLKAVHALPSSDLAAPGGEKASAAPSAARVEVRVDAGKPSDVPVVRDRDLKPGHVLDGPCLVKGDYLTCLVAPAWRLRVTGNHDLVLEVHKQ